ncbi:MAG: DUF4349 domain-containing protein [Leptospiraceae bacterium]|nr:DUF4349 domain-containing protein [Leptospiraceae bacterium]
MKKLSYNLIILFMLFTIGCASSENAYPGGRISGPKGGASGISDGESERGQEYQSSAPKGGKQIQRILVYNSDIYFDIPEGSLDDIKKQIVDYVKSKDGYIVTESTYNITFKIPSDIFREALNYLKTLSKVRDQSIHTEDITAIYYDSKIRLKNMLELQKRLTDLLGKAKNVQDAIEVEKELDHPLFFGQ